MFDDLPDFAIRGECGIDIFRRLDQEGQRRVRFRCVATVADGRVIDHDPGTRSDPARARALAEALATDPMARPIGLADPASWPRAARDGDPIRLFLHLDFLRAWQVADLAIDRLIRQITADPSALPLEPGKLSGAVAPLMDFNRLSRAVDLATLALPILDARMAAPGFADDKAGGTGFALRMLGDLCLRRSEAVLALRCFEGAIVAGDNSHRRRRAIEAAVAAGDAAAAERHRAAYAARWTLPDDLKGPA